jgi:hypothetical protein
MVAIHREPGMAANFSRFSATSQGREFAISVVDTASFLAPSPPQKAFASDVSVSLRR